MMSSPSQSGTTHMMVESVLQQYGWEQGWALLMRLGGNLSAITARSFGVSDGISRGLAGAGLVIDSYALNSQARFDHVGFNIMPDSVILPTYLGVARHSTQPASAALFIQYLLSDRGQAIIATPGWPGRPATSPTRGCSIGGPVCSRPCSSRPSPSSYPG